jgi:hypothetical protein
VTFQRPNFEDRGFESIGGGGAMFKAATTSCGSQAERKLLAVWKDHQKRRRKPHVSAAFPQGRRLILKCDFGCCQRKGKDSRQCLSLECFCFDCPSGNTMGLPDCQIWSRVSRSIRVIRIPNLSGHRDLRCPKWSEGRKRRKHRL